MTLRVLSLAPAAALTALLLAGCGTTTSSASFSGEKHAVAQVVANLQGAAQAGEGSKICSQYLTKTIVSELGGKKNCEEALKHQISLVDNTEVSIKSVSLSADHRSASAKVKGTHSGKSKIETVQLVKEGKSWRVSGP